MRKILLATTLLSIAVSENILMENDPRLKSARICDKQIWNRRTKRIPRKDVPSKIEESLNYDDARQFPRISDTQFISEPRELPSMAVIRRHDLARFSQVDVSSDKSKLDSVEPRILISIGIQEEKSAGNGLQEDCSTRKNYCKQNLAWQIQQPFYVEEPRWVDIDVDYIDSPHRMDNGDPYILSRGKKIYKISDPEQLGKTIENFEATLDYLSKNKKLLIKNRVRRSAKNEEFQDKTDKTNNRINERNHFTPQDMDRDINNNTAIIEIKNSNEKFFGSDHIFEDEKTKDINYDVFNKKYKKNDLNNLAKRSSRGFKFTRQNQISENDIIADFIEQNQKIERKDSLNDIENGSDKIAETGQVERFNNSHFAVDINKRSVLPRNQETRKIQEIYDANFKKDIEKNETEAYEQMENKAYINELNGLDTSDNPFISSRDKDLVEDRIESLNKKDTDRNKFVERTWELHSAHRKKLESEEEAKNDEARSEINNGNIRIIDSQSTNEPNLKNSEATISNYREKRNACKTCKIKSMFQQDEWMRDIKKKIQESLSLERRDKHSDILGRLSEPYIISRGKKAPQDFGGTDNLLALLNSQGMNDEDRAKIISFPVTESLLRMLLTETPTCNDNCDINANQVSYARLTPRDRRGSLDEIFAVNDPYYVARGKRNQKGVLLEADAGK